MKYEKRPEVDLGGGLNLSVCAKLSKYRCVVVISIRSISGSNWWNLFQGQSRTPAPLFRAQLR